MLDDAAKHRLSIVLVFKLDRAFRSVKHMHDTLAAWEMVGVSFVSLGEGIDCTTPAGTLQLHILAALAQFERARIVERVQAGLQGAKRQGRTLGRPQRIISRFQLAKVKGLSTRAAAKALGVPRSTLQRYLAQKPF